MKIASVGVVVVVAVCIFIIMKGVRKFEPQRKLAIGTEDDTGARALTVLVYLAFIAVLLGIGAILGK